MKGAGVSPSRTTGVTQKINTRQTAWGQGPQITVLLTNELSLVKQAACVCAGGSLHSASRHTILEVSDIAQNEWKQKQKINVSGRDICYPTSVTDTLLFYLQNKITVVHTELQVQIYLFIPYYNGVIVFHFPAVMMISGKQTPYRLPQELTKNVKEFIYIIFCGCIRELIEMDSNLLDCIYKSFHN